MNHLPNFTPEERAANLEKARISRQKAREEREANKHLLKLEYLDKGHWERLASHYSVRMPSNEEAVDIKTLRKYIKRVGISQDLWNDHYTSFKYFITNHPTWTKYAAVGLMLELRDACGGNTHDPG